MGSQFLSIVPDSTRFPMLTPVEGFHKSTEVHCPKARRAAVFARQSSRVPGFVGITPAESKIPTNDSLSTGKKEVTKGIKAVVNRTMYS